MSDQIFTLLLAVFGVASVCSPIVSRAQSPETLAQTSVTARWVGTWATASMAIPNAAGALGSPELLYQTVHVSRGGSMVRITLTNELGTDPLQIDAVAVSLRGKGGEPLTAATLAFSGQPRVSIPPGAVAVSDPVALQLPSSADLDINLSLPAQRQATVTAHDVGLETNYEVAGETLASTPPASATVIRQWRFLKNVEVLTSGQSRKSAAIVAFGDSITDGYRSTPGANHRWPDELAARLQADPQLRATGVLNAGISGNRLLHDGTGPSALARFDRDVLSQDGVRYLIILEGINDIGNSTRAGESDAPVTAGKIIAGYIQLVERAHAHGILVYGATITPFLGAGYQTAAGEAMRQTVNSWIRTPGHVDGIIDFDEITNDPKKPGHLLPAYDAGDHLHPSDTGYKAMGDAIDLQLFSREHSSRRKPRAR